MVKLRKPGSMLRAITEPERSPAYRLGGLILFGAAAVILTVLAFEHIGGYLPCPLCLQQRYAYYLAIPALFLALVLVAADNGRSAAVVFALIALALLANAGLGVYHAGAEWKLWDAPATCGTAQPLSTDAGGLLERLSKTRVIRCDEAPWRMLGLSFAGWNVVASALLALGAAIAAAKAFRQA
jgi:disulfide bond formation protein DsbB